MRASLDTNAVIHFYRANLQSILFEFFEDGVFMNRGIVDALQTAKDFDSVNAASELNWTFRSQVAKFIRRFWKAPYRDTDREWMEKIVCDNHISVKSKFSALNKVI